MRFKQDSWDFIGGFGALSRDVLAAILDQSVDCVKILDPQGRIEFMNRNGRCTMEITDFTAIAGRPWDALWPEDSGEAVRAAVGAAQAGEGSRFEAFCPTAAGTPKWWDVSVTPVRDKDGALFAILSISRDVTERRQAMESLETMAHEMRHRLRNAFAVSGAIALASGREDSEHAGFAAALAQRLNTLSVAQSSLIDPDAGESLDALVARITAAFARSELIRAADIPGLPLGEQAARMVALALGELATNSLKHGALGAGQPVEVQAGGEGDRLWLEWRERLAETLQSFDASGEGSGHRLMQRMAKAHGGTFELEFEAGQLRARLETPSNR